MKRKHSIPAFFFLYHPDRDSREFAALARKEGYDRILLLRRENLFVANLHPIQAESERSIWAVYLVNVTPRLKPGACGANHEPD